MKKLKRRADPKLIKLIDRCLEELEHDSGYGKALSGNLRGRRSVRLSQFNYRVVYRVIEGKASDTIVVQEISHRSDVYDEVARGG